MPPLPLKPSHGVIRSAIEIAKDIRRYVHNACTGHVQSSQFRFAVNLRKAIPCRITPNESQTWIKYIDYGRIAIVRITPDSGFGHRQAHHTQFQKQTAQ
jgi:hypothetical protein